MARSASSRTREPHERRDLEPDGSSTEPHFTGGGLPLLGSRAGGRMGAAVERGSAAGAEPATGARDQRDARPDESADDVVGAVGSPCDGSGDGPSDRRVRWSARSRRLGQAGHRGDDAASPRMTASESQVGISGIGRHVLTAVDERQLVGVQRVDDQLGADEAEDDRQPVGEVDQPVEQAVEEEEQLPQAQQRERVGGEDQERLLGQPEDRRDRVDGEEEVGACRSRSARRPAA